MIFEIVDSTSFSYDVKITNIKCRLALWIWPVVTVDFAD